MDKDLTTEPVSADEFGRQSIRRFVQCPGVLRLDSLRGQADRISRMVPDKTPLLDHVQRYLPGDSNGIYGERQLMTHAHPIGTHGTGTETGSGNTSAADVSTSSRASHVTSTGIAHIQRTEADTGAAATVTQDSGNGQPDPVQAKPDRQGKQAANTDVPAAGAADANRTVSEPIINRYLQMPMIMQKITTDKGMIARATAIETAETGHANPTAAAPAAENIRRKAAAPDSPGPVRQMPARQKSETSNNVQNSPAAIPAPQNLGSGIVQRHTGMAVAKPAPAAQKQNPSTGRAPLTATAVTAAPLVQRKETDPEPADLQRAAGMPEEEKDETVQAASIQRSPMTSLGQQKADNRVQAVALPVTESNRHHVLSRVAADFNQPATTVSLAEQTGSNHGARGDRATPRLPLSMPGASGKTLFRKQADNVAPFNGEVQRTANNPGGYTNNLNMPLVSTINRMPDNTVISRRVDAGSIASNEGSPEATAPAEQAGMGGPAVTDELIDKIFSRLLRRMAVESERRGWRF